MKQTQEKVEQFEREPPENLEDRTDVYFTWAKEAAEKAGMNPEVTKWVHAGPREEAEISGLENAAEVLERSTSDEVEVYLTESESFNSREPLMLIEGPLQQVLEPETSVLGVSSHHLTEANEDLGYENPSPEEYGEGFGKAAALLEDLSEFTGEEVGLADFGARHYHPALQEEFAKQAFKNGAAGHSTEAGCRAVNEAFDADWSASGTMNHAYVIPHAAEHGMEDATFEAFRNYDEYIEGTTPVLVDTANAEADDTLRICEHLEEREGEDFELTVRIDTNGANHSQTVPEQERTPENRGVSVDAVRGMNELLEENGYRENVNLLISSGLGKTEKLEGFVEAAKEHYSESGTLLFDGVGAGSFDTTENLYTTSDIVAVDGEPVGKVGRLEELASEIGSSPENLVEDLESYRESSMSAYEPQMEVV